MTTISTPDAPAAIAFYAEVIGWTTQPFGEGGHYTMWVAAQGPLGGVVALGPEAQALGAPPHWMGHVQVADVDAVVARAAELGGRVYKAPTAIPGVGRFAVLGDPQGAVLSAFQPSRVMVAHDASQSGEFCWSELHTSDSAAGFAFYAALFGWTVLQEMPVGPLGTYRIFGVGGRSLGGMMTTPPGAPMPPMWLHYVNLTGLDAAIARAERLGAKLMNGPMEVPGGARIAQLVDPQGAPFALHELPR